jgi:hypothetical protein
MTTLQPPRAKMGGGMKRVTTMSNDDPFMKMLEESKSKTKSVAFPI